MIFDMAIDEFYFGNSYLNVEDKLLARFIIDESIDATGVGVDFNGYNDKVLWW